MTLISSLPLLRVDPLKCHTAQAWAEKKRMNLRTVYRRIEAKELRTVEISGVVFIYGE